MKQENNLYYAKENYVIERISDGQVFGTCLCLMDGSIGDFKERKATKKELEEIEKIKQEEAKRTEMIKKK